MEGGGASIQQRQVLALLLAIGALVLPLSGAVGFGWSIDSPANLFVLGAVDRATLLAPLMLVGALVLTVAGPSTGPVTPSRRATPVVMVAAAVVLAVAYFGAAWELAGPEFDTGSSPWGSGRAAMMADFVIEGVICLVVIGFLGRWRAERNEVPVP